jgi:hypothetical protein
MIKKTRLGLPTLREETYTDYVAQLDGFGSAQAVQDFFLERFSEIKRTDPLYAKFIIDTSAMYPNEDRDIAWAELIAGRELLSREGELPLLDEEKFRKRWDATMNRSVVFLNIGHNMNIIKADNPVFWNFIMNSTNYFPPTPNQERGLMPNPEGYNPKMFIMSDLSSGYMFLADNTREK